MPEWEFEQEKAEPVEVESDAFAFDVVDEPPESRDREARYHTRPLDAEPDYEDSAEPDEESIARADLLSERLMASVRMLSRERPSPKAFGRMISEERYAGYAEGAPMSDVIHNTEQMAHEFALARDLDVPVVGLRTDFGPIPVSTKSSYGPLASIVTMMRHQDRELVRDLFNTNAESCAAQDPNFAPVHVDEAEESAHSNLRGFLAFRFWGWKNRQSELGDAGSIRFGDQAGDYAAGYGLKVRVFSQLPGLRIHIAPAYFIDNWLFFGHPTTPVEGCVLPGRYVFSADGPMMPRRRIDPTVFRIPPSLKVKITRF